MGSTIIKPWLDDDHDATWFAVHAAHRTSHRLAVTELLLPAFLMATKYLTLKAN